MISRICSEIQTRGELLGSDCDGSVGSISDNTGSHEVFRSDMNVPLNLKVEIHGIAFAK
jgi:hypothetical protein